MGKIPDISVFLQCRVVDHVEIAILLNSFIPPLNSSADVQILQHQTSQSIPIFVPTV